MAISMSGATVDTSERDSLLTSTVDTGVIAGGETANVSGGFFGAVFGAEASGADIAGITESFAANVTRAIDSYKSDVQSKLDQLQAVESNSAFQGAAISKALANFVTSVRDVGTDYLNRLSSAETQIINSVAAAYKTQDTDLSGNLGSDAGSIGIHG